MKIPTIREQKFGDLNRQLNRIRARMNREVRERYQLLRQKKTEDGDKNE